MRLYDIRLLPNCRTIAELPFLWRIGQHLVVGFDSTLALPHGWNSYFEV